MVSAFIGGSIQLKCNISSLSNNTQTFWLVTKNKTDYYEIEDVENKYSKSSDGALNITNIDLIDEEFYFCAYLNTAQEPVVLSEYFLFVKGLY